VPSPKQGRYLWLEIRSQVPLDSWSSPASKLRVGTTERRTARERRSIAAGPSSGPGRGVRRPQNNVPGRVDASACALRLPTPEEEDYGLRLRRHRRDDRRGQVLPARVRVAPSLAPTDGEDGVKEKDAMAGPGFERRIGRPRAFEVASPFREDVAQRRRWPSVVRNGECQTLRFAGSVVRILAYDDGPYYGQWGQAQGREDVIGRRVDLAFDTLLGNESLETYE